MSGIIRVLHISPDFNYSCGVSTHVYLLLKNFVNDKSYKVFFITNGGDALDKLDKINLTPEIVKFEKGFRNIFYLYSNLQTIRKYCVRNKIDIIHTHHRYPEFLASLISKKTGARTITTVESLVKGRTRLSFKSDKIIAVSNSVKELLINHYNVPQEKITMLNNFIEPPDMNGRNLGLNIKSSLQIPMENKVILFLGRITKIKGVDLLIEAFKLVRNKNEKVTLVIVGQVYDNSMKSSLKELPDGIIVLNVVKDPIPYYEIADLVVLPSRIEPFPYVMLEAGMMQKPFIGARTGGIAEFIEDGVNGLLFEPESVDQLVTKIESLLKSDKNSKILSKNLYNKVIDNCSIKKYYSNLDKIYNELLG